jgi:hypothetical protein
LLARSTRVPCLVVVEEAVALEPNARQAALLSAHNVVDHLDVAALPVYLRFHGGIKVAFRLEIGDGMNV